MSKIYNDDCLNVMKSMPENGVDAIITDPPYGLDFMGEEWDHGVPGVVFWQEALRIAKPGAYLLAFGGTRTYHRLACAIEDAGWEIRDTLAWMYSQGFPKSMDVSKAIDKKFGVERERGPVDPGRATRLVNQLQGYETNAGWSFSKRTVTIDPPATPEASRWNGWGTCLKPAYEPIVMARKPLDGTVVENVLKHGTGAINIDACRVPSDEPITIHSPARETLFESGHKDLGTWENNKGRFPANLIHDGSEEVVSCFPDNVKSGSWVNTDGDRRFNNNGRPTNCVRKGDDKSVGSAARFFYCAKASKKEKGLDNDHPTVKPIALMRYLVKLVCRKGGTVLDPFCGSGSTGVACAMEGMDFIGCEKDAHYARIAETRVELRNIEND